LFVRKGIQYELVPAKYPFSPSITKLVPLVLGREPAAVEGLDPVVLVVLVEDVDEDATVDRVVEVEDELELGTHWLYHGFRYEQYQPGLQVVSPLQFVPPH
jgi:hypothetical protein